MQPGLVSILTPAYNAEPFIAEALDSAIAQTYSDWELLVVNDGSTDGTAGVVERYTDPRIRLFSKANGGEASARNYALDRMRGEFVALLDADDAFLPNHLEETVQYLVEHPDVAGVYTDGYHVNERGDRLQPLSSRRRGPFGEDVFAEVVRSSDVLSPPSCIVLRSELIAAHGWRFDEQIGYGTDWDFWVRCAEVGRFGYLPAMTLHYRVHGSNMTTTMGEERRRRFWARCREKAIKLDRFRECPTDVRSWVFYDLLVNLLTGNPERQSAVVEWPEFHALPAEERARIYRLMASKAIVARVDRKIVHGYFRAAGQLGDLDLRTRLLRFMHRLSPAVCASLLRAKLVRQNRAVIDPVFGNLGSFNR
jgi:glycosyltransferase involved in cell wall biosynthesis